MHFYELKIDLSLKNKIHFQSSPEALGKLIATALIRFGYKVHNENRIKNYVFSNLEIRAKKEYYEGDNFFRFRSFDKELILKLSNSFLMYEDTIFKINKLSSKVIYQKPIKLLETSNPVFVTILKNRFWTFREDGNIMKYITLLHQNALKKSKLVNPVETDENFMEYMEFLNKKPFTFKYKNSKFFGFKLKIYPKNDEISQNLAFIVAGMGVGEKNSAVGGGFCKVAFSKKNDIIWH